jgi:hypothetical protein
MAFEWLLTDRYSNSRSTTGFTTSRIYRCGLYRRTQIVSRRDRRFLFPLVNADAAASTGDSSTPAFQQADQRSITGMPLIDVAIGRFCRCNELRRNVTRIPLDSEFCFRYQPPAFLPQFNSIQIQSPI